MTWHPQAPQGKESAKIRPFTTHYTQGRGLDIGCGSEKLWHESIGIDSGKQWGRPVADITGDGSDLTFFANHSMNYVFSSHFLEHVVDYRGTLAEWWRVIRPGGFLVLYLPHKHLYPNIGQPGANPDHKHDFLPQDIGLAMQDIARGTGEGWTLVEDEVRAGGHEYSFYQVYRKRSDPQIVVDPWRKPAKSCLVIRYGGIGDMIQASSLFPKLKEEGWHVTLNTTPQRAAVMMHDPHIDDFWTQATDQVPQSELGTYWSMLGERYDRVINLSEATEGALLAIPGRTMHGASQAARHAIMNRNYVEFLHTWAGVDGPFNPRFYATEEERAAMQEELASYGGPVILWALSGSSSNKVYPWIGPAVSQILTRSDDVRVLFVGGKEPKDQQLQEVALKGIRRFVGEERAKRVICRAGEWGVRKSLTAALLADVVVGPETGVLNAAAMEDNRKIVLLSHSSVENLTRDWVNTVSLSGGEPDHRLHYGFDHLDVDPDTGAAKVLANIKPDAVADAVLSGFSKWREADKARLVPAPTVELIGEAAE